jgi:hypothetical protein
LLTGEALGVLDFHFDSAKNLFIGHPTAIYPEGYTGWILILSWLSLELNRYCLSEIQVFTAASWLSVKVAQTLMLSVRWFHCSKFE